MLSTGMLDYLRRHHPEARFTIACGPVAAGLFDRLPGRERTLIIEKRRGDLHWWRLWRQCVGTRWDLAVDLRGSAVTWLLPARRRAVMRGGRRPGHRTTHLARVLGLDPAPSPVVWTAAADRAAAASLLGSGRVLIGLGPTANWSGKVWPASRFATLFGRLAEAVPGAVPVIFAGPGAAERAMAAPLLAALPQAVDLCGRLSLPEAAACLARCDLFIGNDSGLMHLAAATGAPTLGLFGPSRADEYAPVGRRTRAVIAPGAPGVAPITGLRVESVLAAALPLLASTLSPAPC